MQIHFIAVGGAVMHNMALAMHQKGYIVTGSDDEINEPSLTRLQSAGILPPEYGWFPDKITNRLDAVILGMHARSDNPELLKAQQLGLKIFSFPEYLFEQSKNKIRVVIGGSHGKTSITAMIMHVLKFHKQNFDYMVGSQLDGFETMVKITTDAPVIILEGDEYLSSPVDRRPKFHLYHPHVALLSGIAWDHINVFPTFENYVEQFRIFTELIEKNGVLIYCKDDKEVTAIANKARNDIRKMPYSVPEYKIENGITSIESPGSKFETPLLVFGRHNLMNLEGARLVCEQIGIGADDFHQAIASFKGAARRLELVARNNSIAVYKDFAHSPSKLKATINAVREQFANHKIIACMELHTFSSLNENFLAQYSHCMDEADVAYVYFNPHTIEHKKLKPVSVAQVCEAFKREDLKVFTDSKKMEEELFGEKLNNTVVLMMSSGNFDGIKWNEFGEKILSFG